jgi:hypothetical protein
MISHQFMAERRLRHTFNRLTTVESKFAMRVSFLVLIFLFGVQQIRLFSDEPVDVCFWTPFDFDVHQEGAEIFRYNGIELGTMSDGFEKVLAKLATLPAGSSIVWGPEYSRCYSCGSTSRTISSRYPAQWTKLKAIAHRRNLHLSAFYPTPPIVPKPAAENATKFGSDREATASFFWSNYYGELTEPGHVLYYLDNRFIGVGDAGLDAILRHLKTLPYGSSYTFPKYELSGRLAFERFTAAEITKFNEKLRGFKPFLHRVAEFREVIAERMLVYRSWIIPSPISIHRDDSASWGTINTNSLLASTGRIVRRNQELTKLDAVLDWRDYHAALSDEQRRPESSSTYTLNSRDIGKGIEGFKKITKMIDNLPNGANLAVRVCIRTQAPFVCPVVVEGERHFEQTGYEPYKELLPWLLTIVEKKHLNLFWLPDEAGPFVTCEFSK